MKGDNPFRPDAEALIESLRASDKFGVMVSVPAGEFFMGCNDAVDSECDDDEKPGRRREPDASFADYGFRCVQ